MSERALERDEVIAIMIAELDARLHDRGTVEVVAWPDKEDDIAETVELIARDSGGEIVVEHTRTESYPGQIDDNSAVYDYFARGGPELRDSDDFGAHLMLVVPIQTFSGGLPRKKRRPAGDLITDWVRVHARQVPWPHEPDGPIAILGSHELVPFGWALGQHLPSEVRLIGPLADVVRVGFSRPGNLEDLRGERLEVALARKLHKLHAAAGGVRRSVLVIEDRDTVMSNPIDTSTALQAASLTHQLPDAIYLLNTRMGNPYAGVIFDEGIWAHRRDGFHWESFSDERSSQLNALQTNWR